MNFSLFHLALYQLWDNFLISETTGIDVKNTTQHTLPTSVCALSWHADSGKRNTSTVAWFQASNAVYMRSAVFWDFTQRLLVFCRRFETTVGVREISTAVLVKIKVIWDVAPCWLVNLPSSSGPTVQDEGTTFHRNFRNPSPVDRTQSSSLLVLERHVSQNRRPCRAELVCMTRLLRICEDHSFRALWYIKTLVNTNTCTF